MGEAGEAAAREHLVARGYVIVAVDWRCRLGQIDIVAADGATLVIVEVKARRGTGFGLPQEGVDARKRQKLRHLADAFIAASRRTWRDVRIDVIALLVDAELRVVRLEHIENAVEG